jgi:hypothetical protein
MWPLAVNRVGEVYSKNGGKGSVIYSEGLASVQKRLKMLSITTPIVKISSQVKSKIIGKSLMIEQRRRLVNSLTKKATNY